MTQPVLRGVGTGGLSAGRLGAVHPVSMRAAPTVTLSGGLNLYDGVAVMQTTSIATNYSTTDVVELDVYTNATTGLGQAVVAYQSGSVYMDVDAEL